MTACVLAKAHTQTFTAGFCITAKHWTQPKCPSTGESKILYVHNNKYSSTILKRNTLLINAIIQESQNTMLNKRSQTWKRACWLIPFTWSSGEAKLEKWLPGVSVGERALESDGVFSGLTVLVVTRVCSTYVKTHPLHTSNGYVFLNCGKIHIHGT